MVAVRDGLHDAATEWALVKSMPLAASLSKFGVTDCALPPRHPIQSFRSSTEMNRTLGGFSSAADTEHNVIAAHIKGPLIFARDLIFWKGMLLGIYFFDLRSPLRGGKWGNSGWGAVLRQGGKCEMSIQWYNDLADSKISPSKLQAKKIFSGHYSSVCGVWIFPLILGRGTSSTSGIAISPRRCLVVGSGSMTSSSGSTQMMPVRRLGIGSA